MFESQQPHVLYTPACFDCPHICVDVFGRNPIPNTKYCPQNETMITCLCLRHFSHCRFPVWLHDHRLWSGHTGESFVLILFCWIIFSSEFHFLVLVFLFCFRIISLFNGLEAPCSQKATLWVIQCRIFPILSPWWMWRVYLPLPPPLLWGNKKMSENMQWEL